MEYSAKKSGIYYVDTRSLVASYLVRGAERQGLVTSLSRRAEREQIAGGLEVAS